MPRNIDKEIGENEILVRFIFDSNFKRKILNEENIIDGEVFLDLRGVSMQREKYCIEKQCKFLAKKIPKNYVGFVIFRKSHFDEVKISHKQIRTEFEAIIKATPLDIHNNYIPDEIIVSTKTDGNPSHSDLFYINPAVGENESPKTALRSFSRKLLKKSKLILDDDAQSLSYFGEKFQKVV